MRYLTLAFLCLALLHIQSAAQEKKRLSHDDYDHWKTLSGIKISEQLVTVVKLSEMGLTPQESYVYRKASFTINIRPQPGSNKFN